MPEIGHWYRRNPKFGSHRSWKMDSVRHYLLCAYEAISMHAA